MKPRRRLVALVLCVGSGLLVSGQASAATLTVCLSGCQFTTIPAALSAANSGDTISVGPGNYGGGLTIAKSDVLRGAGAGQTTLAGGGPVVSVQSGVSVL